MLRLWHRASWLLVLIPALSAAAVPRAGAQPAVTIQDCGGVKVTFTFGNRLNLPGQPAYPRLSGPQKDAFASAFCQEITNVRTWYINEGWGSAPTLPDLQVDVDDKYESSASLAHLALGENGRMDFPAREVEIGQTGIAHELTHLYLPNGNRLLAEGLAVYVQQKIGTNHAMPNFGKSLDQLVREFTCGMHLVEVPKPDLENIRFTEADKIATPTLLTLRIGVVPYTSGYVYAIIGSFVQFLIDNYGMEKFRTLYNLTPLRPRERNEGSPERWARVYGVKLTTLERNWRSQIANLKCAR